MSKAKPARLYVIEHEWEPGIWSQWLGDVCTSREHALGRIDRLKLMFPGVYTRRFRVAIYDRRERAR